VTFYGEDPTPTGSNPWQKAYGSQNLDSLIARFPWDRLQLLQLNLAGPNAPG
jgi:hypothetical protein